MCEQIWFNTRVLCCEEKPELASSLQAARARVRWAPWSGLADAEPQRAGRWRTATGDWANPDYPYSLTEGNEIVLIRWPDQNSPAERVRWWLCGVMHLCESARRSRVRLLALGFDPEAPPLLLRAALFLEEYLSTLDLNSLVCKSPQLLKKQVEEHLALR